MPSIHWSEELQTELWVPDNESATQRVDRFREDILEINRLVSNTLYVTKGKRWNTGSGGYESDAYHITTEPHEIKRFKANVMDTPDGGNNQTLYSDIHFYTNRSVHKDSLYSTPKPVEKFWNWASKLEVGYHIWKNKDE